MLGKTLLGLLTLLMPAAQPRLVVTVVDQFGAPITDLKAEDFAVFQDKNPRQVQSAKYVKDMVDIVLMADTSAYAASGRNDIVRFSDFFISQLADKEQMAIIGYATSADLMQDFTSSKQLLRRAISGFKFGNDAAILDSAYAALDGGFQQTVGRRILLIISSGMEGVSKVRRPEVVDLAQRNRVSIFALSLSGRSSPLDKLGEESGGAFFGGRELRQIEQISKNLLDAFRGHYELEIGPGDGKLDGKFKVEIRNPREKLQINYRKIE